MSLSRAIAKTLDALAGSVNMWTPLLEPEPTMTATEVFRIEIAYEIPDTEPTPKEAP